MSPRFNSDIIKNAQEAISYHWFAQYTFCSVGDVHVDAVVVLVCLRAVPTKYQGFLSQIRTIRKK